MPLDGPGIDDGPAVDELGNSAAEVEACEGPGDRGVPGDRISFAESMGKGRLIDRS